MLLLTTEIEQLRSLGSDDHVRAAVGLKIDEAAKLIERVGLLDDGASYWTAVLRIGSDEPVTLSDSARQRVSSVRPGLP